MSKHIEVGYSTDSLFGNDPDTVAGVDVPASIDQYNEMLITAIRAEWPTADIEVECGDNDYTRINGRADTIEVADLGEIISRVWESWDCWVVSA